MGLYVLLWKIRLLYFFILFFVGLVSVVLMLGCCDCFWVLFDIYWLLMLGVFVGDEKDCGVGFYIKFYIGSGCLKGCWLVFVLI